jgi:hypothetical protein
MQSFRSFIAQHPARYLVIGKTLFLAGTILILAAIFARAGLFTAPWAVVPQGPVGFSISAALVLAGMLLTVVAEKALKR